VVLANIGCPAPREDSAQLNRVGKGGWRRSYDQVPVAIFRQINKEQPRVHHDALEFPDGRIVLLAMLGDGQEATVLQLPAQPTSVPKKRHKNASRGLAETFWLGRSH